MERTHSGITPSPRTAVIWASLRAELDARAGHILHVIDVGGGTGGFAVPLAEAGHRVTVIDASPDALASLARRAEEAGVADRVTARQGDGDQLATLVPAGGADLVLCHSVLEEVDDPAAVMAAVAEALRPGGAASVVVANWRGTVLARGLAGHLAAATALLDDHTRRRPEAAAAAPRHPGAAGSAAPRRPGAAGGKAQRRFDADGATALVEAAGLTVAAVHGVRVVADLLGGALADVDPHALLDFELAASEQPVFRDIATQLHLLARRAG